MYRGYTHTASVVGLTSAERSGLNPDVADQLTEVDRNAVLEQQQIDQCHDKEDYSHQLQQLQLRRSKSNIHEGKDGTAQQQQPQRSQHATLALPSSSATTAPPSPALDSSASTALRSLQQAPPPGSLLSQAGAGGGGAAVQPARHRPKVVDKATLDRRSTMHLQLDAILNQQIKALLDPNDPSVSRPEMASWDASQLDQLVASLKPQHLPELIRQSMLINELQPAKLMTWKNLTLVNSHGQPLLNNVTGYLAPGHMVGVFAGPDGGATPLLNVLGQRKVQGKVSGEILYNAKVPDETFNKTVGYVVKEDPHLATLTVYETIYFSARLRLPSPTPDSLVRFRVLMIMKLLGLSHVANNLVGNASIRGISGGEKRRVSFAVEMVVGHSVLLADLPTNGLDSATAFALMRTMRFACRAATSMLCSIVQPSPELFRLFHRVVVLSKGATVYFGPPEYAETHLAGLGFIRPPAKTVPQFLEELSAAPEKFYQPTLARAVSDWPAPGSAAATLTEWEEKQLGASHTKSLGILRPTGKAAHAVDPRRGDCWNRLVDAYERSEFRELLDEAMVAELNRSREEERALEAARERQDPAARVSLAQSGLMKYWYRRYNSSPWQQMQQNVTRLATLFYRDRGMWRDTWVVNSLMSVFLGSLFYDLHDSQQDMSNRVGLLFFFAAYIGFGGLSLAPVISYHRPTYYAQMTASYFHPFTYFFSFVLLLTPIVIIDTFLLLLPAYGLANLTGGIGHAEFGFALVCLIVTALASRSWVLIVLSLSKNETLANVGLVESNILFFLLAGFLIRGDEIEAAYYWFHIIDYFTYSFRALAVNDLAPRYQDCDRSLPGCNFNTGDDALTLLYGLHSGSKPWIDFARLCGVWGAFTIAAAFAYLLINWDVPDDTEGPNWGAAIPTRFSSVTLDSTSSMPPDAPAEGGKGLQDATSTDVGVAAPGSVEMAEPAKDNQQRLQADGGRGMDGVDGRDGVDGQQQGVASPRKKVAREGTIEGFHFKKAYIQWRDLCYDVVLPDGSTRRLLNQVYGYAAPGKMCALMGASGAGKSTLLDVLAGLKNQGTISGELLINGRPRDEMFTSIVGYAEQFDSHSPLATIFEAVRFSGRLRLPSTVTDHELDKKVRNVLSVLEIDHLANAIIGSPGMGGVAPEIRKKVTIAVELIMEPAILFLDEPTTGLDSAGAYAVIATVNKLSQHMAVVCTIHQPPIEIVNMFSQIILLKAGGEVVYFGPMDQLTSYFHSQGLGEAAPDKNPVDFALEQLKQANELAAGHKQGLSDDPLHSSKPAQPNAQPVQGQGEGEQQHAPPPGEAVTQVHVQGGSEEEKVAGDEKSRADSLHYDTPQLTLHAGAAGRLPQAFLESEQSKEVRVILERGICPAEEVASDQAAEVSLQERRGDKAWFTTQVAELTRRNFLTIVRNRFGLKVRFGTTILFSFFVGTIFLRLGYNQQWGSERLSVIFIAVANTLYGSSAFLPEVYMTRTIYFREHTARMYSAGAFFVARYLGDAPFVIAEVFIQSVMLYFLTHLTSYDHSVNFGYFFWCLLIVRWMSIAMTHTFGTVVASPGFAATLLIAYMNTMFAACGFFQPRPSFPQWWVWYFDLVPIRYALDFLVQREYVNDQFYCDDSEKVLVYADEVNCPAQSQLQPSGFYLQCPYACGADFLVHFGVQASDTWQVRNFAILHCFMIFFFITAYLSLRLINHIKR